MPGVPMRLSETPIQLRGAPLLGEHTAEVLAELGFVPSDLVALRQEGAI